MDTDNDRGWVKPLATDGGITPLDPSGPDGSRRPSPLVGGLVLVLVAAVAIAGVVMWRGRNGDPFGSTGSMPADMDFVVTFDALALSDSERLQSFVDAFSGPMFDAGLIDERPADLVDAIDRALGEETGFTLTGDILPWIGRSVSVGGTVPAIEGSLDNMYDFQPSFLLSADVRDDGAAAAFLDKLQSFFENDGVQTSPTVIGDLEGFTMGDEYVALAVVHGDGTLLVGFEEDVVAASEARESGVSLANDSLFVDTMTLLPADQLVSFYMSGRVLGSLAALGSVGLPEAPVIEDAALASTSLGGSVGLVDDGLLMTYVTVGEDNGTELVGPDLAALEALPADTLAFMSIGGPQEEGDFELDRAVLDDLGLPPELIENEFGVDVVAILESLSGDFTIAATESRDSSIARETEVPVGVVGVLGLTDPSPFADLLGTLTGLLGQEGMSLAIDGEVTSIVVESDEFVSYSLQDDLLVLGTGPTLVGDVVAGAGGGVVNTDVYRELDAALEGDGLVVYADVHRILRLVPMTSDEAAVVAPLRGVGVGAEVIGGASIVEFLLLVDY